MCGYHNGSVFRPKNKTTLLLILRKYLKPISCHDEGRDGLRNDVSPRVGVRCPESSTKPFTLDSKTRFKAYGLQNAAESRHSPHRHRRPGRGAFSETSFDPNLWLHSTVQSIITPFMCYSAAIIPFCMPNMAYPSCAFAPPLPSDFPAVAPQLRVQLSMSTPQAILVGSFVGLLSSYLHPFYEIRTKRDIEQNILVSALSAHRPTDPPSPPTHRSSGPPSPPTHRSTDSPTRRPTQSVAHALFAPADNLQRLPQAPIARMDASVRGHSIGPSRVRVHREPGQPPRLQDQTRRAARAFRALIQRTARCAAPWRDLRGILEWSERCDQVRLGDVGVPHRGGRSRAAGGGG